WHSIGHVAGPDFPFLAWELAHGRPVPPIVARPGVRWIRRSTDLPTSRRQIMRRKLGIRSFMASLRHVEGAIFQRDDPLPAIVEYPLLLRLLLRRVRLGHGV